MEEREDQDEQLAPRGLLPAFLGAKAQDFRTLGAFRALRSPVGAQSQVSIGLLKGRGL